jgi:hypothetical protein
VWPDVDADDRLGLEAGGPRAGLLGRQAGHHHERHRDHRAPLIYHPILLKEFYPYLDDDASGHYQVGRGYLERTDRPTEVSYFEPWNQQRFDPSEPFISRVQWRDAFKSYRGNQAHYAHNIGV